MRDAPSYLGMDKSRFNREVRPLLEPERERHIYGPSTGSDFDDRCHLGDHVHFDANAKRQLCHTAGAARMDALLAENLDKEFRRPIRDFVRFREVWRPVDHD